MELSLPDEFLLVLGPPVPFGGGEADPVAVERARALWVTHGAGLLDEWADDPPWAFWAFAPGVPDDARDGDAEVRRDWVRRVLLAG